MHSSHLNDVVPHYNVPPFEKKKQKQLINETKWVALSKKPFRKYYDVHIWVKTKKFDIEQKKKKTKKLLKKPK